MAAVTAAALESLIRGGWKTEAYSDRQCKNKLGPEKPFGPCEAGTSQTYPIYVRNEGHVTLEKLKVSVAGEYWLPGDLSETGMPESMGAGSADKDLRVQVDSGSLRPGDVCEAKVTWSCPIENWYPLHFALSVSDENAPAILISDAGIFVMQRGKTPQPWREYAGSRGYGQPSDWHRGTP